MRLLVVRYLAFKVVRALMRARHVTAVSAESVFKATAGRAVFVSTVSFGLQRRGFGLFGNLGRQNVSRLFGRDLLNGGWLRRL